MKLGDTVSISASVILHSSDSFQRNENLLVKRTTPHEVLGPLKTRGFYYKQMQQY